MKKPRIAEAVGHAGGTGAVLAAEIEAAMAAAHAECTAKGIADDTPPEKVVKLLGRKFEGMCGADVIRAAKLEARAKVKAARR